MHDEVPPSPIPQDRSTIRMHDVSSSSIRTWNYEPTD